MSQIIIGIAGLMASGKDVAKKYLEREYDASSHRYSTVLRDVLNRLYLPITRENLQFLSTDLRRSFGSDTIARVIAQDIKNDPHPLVIVEGIRRLADIVELKNFPNFFLLSIDADQKLRYDRLIKRNENVGDAEKTFVQFESEEKKEAELEIPVVMAEARYHLDNNGTLEDLYRQIDNIIKEIKK